MPHIVSIAYTPADVERHPRDRFARVAVSRAKLVEDAGIDGDVKGRGGRRQLNLMRAEMVETLRGEGFHTDPGELGEQIVIAGLDSASLTVGKRLCLGRVDNSCTIEVACGPSSKPRRARRATSPCH